MRCDVLYMHLEVEVSAAPVVAVQYPQASKPFLWCKFTVIVVFQGEPSIGFPFLYLLDISRKLMGIHNFFKQL